MKQTKEQKERDDFLKAVYNICQKKPTDASSDGLSVMSAYLNATPEQQKAVEDILKM